MARVNRSDSDIESQTGRGWAKDEYTIDGVKFTRTCMACPEQYDVTKGGQEIGYVRLRHGILNAEYTYGDKDEFVYARRYEDARGRFESDDERKVVLQRIANILKLRHKQEQSHV